MKRIRLPKLLPREQLLEELSAYLLKIKNESHYSYSNTRCVESTLHHFRRRLLNVLAMLLLPFVLITLVNFLFFLLNIWIVFLSGVYLLTIFYYWKSRAVDFNDIERRLLFMQQKTDLESCKIEELQAILLGATPNELMALKRTEVLKTWTNMIGFNFKNYGGNSRSEVFHRYLGVDWMLSKIFKVEEIENLSKEEKSYLWSPLLKIEQSTLQHKVFQAQNKIESILENPKDCTTEDMEWALDQITKLRIFVERYDHFLVSTQGILSNALNNCQKNH